MNKRWLAGLLVVLLASVPVARAEGDDPLFNVVRLDAQVEREIPNDEMAVLLVAEDEGADTAKLAEKINEAMSWALDVAQRGKDIRARTRNYQTYPLYNRNVVAGWRASQELELRSENIAALTRLLGTLQQRLQVRQMSFNPTDATRKKHEDELIEAAMEAFHARVTLVGRHMPQQNHRIVELNVATGGAMQPPMPMMMERAMMASDLSSPKVAPAVEGGVSRIVVSVSGSVQYY